MAKKNEDMTWEELEEMFGIRLEKPNEKNRKVAKDAGIEAEEKGVTEQAEWTVEQPTMDLPEVIVETPKPAPRTKRSAPSTEKRSLPSVEEPSYSTHVDVEVHSAPSVRDNKRGDRVEEVYVESLSSQLRRVIHPSDIRKGILWSEILQPPLARRRR